jgi:hypothetical protein
MEPNKAKGGRIVEPAGSEKFRYILVTASRHNMVGYSLDMLMAAGNILELVFACKIPVQLYLVV